jgi:hypothetical protein
VQRVLNSAIRIYNAEGTEAGMISILSLFVACALITHSHGSETDVVAVILGAILHDVGDYKYSGR